MADLRGLPKTVWLIGLISLINDSASEMIYPLIPLYLSSVLMAGLGRLPPASILFCWLYQSLSPSAFRVVAQRSPGVLLMVWKRPALHSAGQAGFACR